MNTYKSLLETTQNTRELGGIQTIDGKITKHNKFWRSEVQQNPSDNDINLLLENNITTIIDMRSEYETQRVKSGFCDDTRFKYENYPITIGAAIPETPEDVPVSYLEMTKDYDTMRRIFTLLANSNGGVMFNCTAGKDRTGVVSAILLMLANVSNDIIADNYMLTKEYAKKMLEMLPKKFPNINMCIVIPSSEYMIEFLRMFKSEYGSAEGYFDILGISDYAVTIRNKLV